MFAKLKHLAIVSDQYTLLGRFYEGMFGMKPSQNARPFGAVVVRDGYVGLNINPRKGKAGRQAGLPEGDHWAEDGRLFEGQVRVRDGRTVRCGLVPVRGPVVRASRRAD